VFFDKFFRSLAVVNACSDEDSHQELAGKDRVNLDDEALAVRIVTQNSKLIHRLILLLLLLFLSVFLDLLLQGRVHATRVLLSCGGV